MFAKRVVHRWIFSRFDVYQDLFSYNIVRMNICCEDGMKQKKEILALVLLMDIVIAFTCLTICHRYYINEEKSLASESSAEAETEKLLALTFDDGPHRTYTKKLLDGLKERDVKVTFFLVGENIEGNEELVKQMSDDGHLIGTHCYSHGDLTKKSISEACSDIVKTNGMIEKITGKRPEYIRPPYGIWNDELDGCVDMTPVFWDIDTLDWKSQNRAKVIRHIEKNVGKHQVILLHDVFDTSVDAALQAIDTLTKQGYTFVTVDELLID